MTDPQRHRDLSWRGLRRRFRGLPRRRRVGAIAATVLVLALVVAGASLAFNRPPGVRVSDQFVTGTPEPGGVPVRLDTSLYLPDVTPAPAVLLAHGLGGTKAGLDAQARDLAQHGFAVLTYTARGFGASGGLIHLDALPYEIADGSRLLDYLQTRPEVERHNGRPVLAVAGGSYGGALALMLGATDHRIAAVAADITWHNLADAVFPNDSTGSGSATGVYKKLWVGYLFSISMRPGATGDAAGAPGSGGGASDPGATAGAGSGCGRFAPDVCAFYQRTGTSAAAAQQSSRELLAQSSPATVLGRMQAPTLLTQGEQDSLFPLSEADANAHQIAAAGAPVYVRWRAGGHDAAVSSDDVNGWQRQFLQYELQGRGAAPERFVLAQAGAGISATNGRTVDTTLRARAGYPGVSGPAPVTSALALSGPPQTISAPPGGSPAAITALPGLGSVLSAASSAGISAASGLSVLPGQDATFVTDPLPVPRLVTGTSSVSLTVSAAPSGPSTPTGAAAVAPATATLFLSLRDLAADGTMSLPANLVAPVSVALPAGPSGRTVTVALPWVVAQVPAGHRLAVVVSSTDFGFAMPSDARSYRVALDASAGQLRVPFIETKTIRTGNVLRWPIGAAIVVLLALAYLMWRLRSTRAGSSDPGLADVPVAITDLVKEYADGYRAVDGVSFRVERGQVLGLLGPNGAGKTTTLRVLMGLIMPTSGSVRVFGDEVVPGAAVLSELGAFVEGPGLLPHLSGRDNLRLYWAASGRDEAAAELDTVLEIAGLGASLERKVKTYSHGMQQRLAIAQAMLGLPEVLILDEPTNGLDPPQIAEMREVLHRYAATGRTVIVSSHLLAEVEQTCTHVVVMARGRLVAAGSVAEVAGAGAEQLVVADPAQAQRVLAQAGISARAVPARRALEDVFLDLIGERYE